MRWKPKPHFDKSRNQWYYRYRNQKHYLGPDIGEAYRRFANIVGQDPPRPDDPTVAEAIELWLTTRRNSRTWESGLLKSWALYAVGARVREINTKHLAAYSRCLEESNQAPWTIRHKVSLAYAVLR